MGPICANGLLHAAAELAGGRVETLGDGVRGRRVAGHRRRRRRPAHRAVRPAARRAPRSLVADPDPERLAAAAALGLDVLDAGTTDDLAGVQAALGARAGRPRRRRRLPVPRPGRRSCTWRCASCARRARVIDLAFYQGGADELRLGEEFHHNGLAMRCAQIGRVPRGLAGTWDRSRLAGETAQLLAGTGADVRTHLVTHVVPLEQAPPLVMALARREVTARQVVLTG